MRIIIDFDDTIFDTTAQIKKTMRLVTLHDVSVKDWQKAWPAMFGVRYRGKGLYSIWEHVKRLQKQTKFDGKKFLHDYIRLHETEAYLFPDTLDFLQFARKVGRIVLVTYGHRKFQLWKIKIARVAPFLHRVKIVSGPKARNFGKILAKQEMNIFLDDKAAEIDEVKKAFPQVICFKVARPGTRHAKQVSKYKDFEVKNLLQARVIISDLANWFTSDLDQATKVLKAGKAVVYPTDTAYGLGVDATNLKAVRRLYQIKGRSFRQPVHIVVDSLQMAKRFALFDNLAEKLFKKLMPGPLTLVLPLTPALSHKGRGGSWEALSAGTGTIGIRMPDNKIALTLVKKLDRPITTPSANPSGGPAPYTAIESYKQFYKQTMQPDLYLDAGALPKTKPSTMVEIKNGKIKLLRAGPISLKQIQKNSNVSP